MNMEITITPILSDADAAKAEARIEELWEAEPGTPESHELDILSLLLAEYEKKDFPVGDINPIEMIKYRMEQMGISQSELAALAFNGHRGRVSEVLQGKRKLNLSMIRTLSEVLRVSPEFLIKEY